MASAQALWGQIVAEWQNHCCFDTDDWKAYKKVLPNEQHYISKELTQPLNDSIAPCVNGVVGWSEKHFHSQRKWKITSWHSSIFSGSSILNSQPYISDTTKS